MERLSTLTKSVSSLPRGTAFGRYALALLRAKGDLLHAAELAARWNDTPQVGLVLRSAAQAGTTTASDWAMSLVDYRMMSSEFVELLRPATIIGRLPGVRRVPFNIRYAVLTQGGSVAWVAQTGPKPVGELKLSGETLGFAKAAGVLAFSNELIRSSAPGSDTFIRQEMISAMAQFLDAQFVDPAVAAVVDVHPASVTNGLTPIPAGTDLRSAVGALFAAVPNPTSPVLICSPAVALALAGAESAAGNPLFPQAGVSGGSIYGVPLLTSGSVPAEILVLLDAAQVLIADDNIVTLSVSDQAALQMDNAPTGGASSLLSLWQYDLAALLAERFINWRMRRADAVAYVNGIA